jgi:hypothetical protein
MGGYHGGKLQYAGAFVGWALSYQITEGDVNSIGTSQLGGTDFISRMF